MREEVGRVALGTRKGSSPGMGERRSSGPVGCGLQAACGRMSFSGRLAKTAAAKGGRDN